MAKEKEVVFLNPFDKGVSYEAFLKTIPSGVNIEKHCEKHLTKDQVDWLKKEIEILKK